MAVATHPLDTICKLLDLSPRRVQQLSKEGVIPKAERGRYELVPAVRGYISYLKERTVTGDVKEGDNVISFDEARRRKIAAEAALAELELEKERGNVVSIEQTQLSNNSLRSNIVTDSLFTCEVFPTPDNYIRILRV